MPTTVREPAAPPPRQTTTTPWLAIAAIVLLAAVLRFATLRTQSLWFDEAATWDLVRRPFGEMLRQIPKGESNPPLFYVLEWAWTRVFGDGEAGLRSLPALAGLLTVPVAYAIGRRTAGEGSRAAARAGLAAAALVAVNPLLVWYAQEARSYALATLMSAVALLLMLRAGSDRRGRVLAAWALAGALALATHYFTAFVLAPQAAWLLWRHPRRRDAAAAVGALAAAGLALLPLLIAQSGNPYDIAGTSLVVRLAQVPKQFLLGYRGPLALPFGVLGALLVLGAAWLLASRTPPAPRERALLLVAIGCVAVALPLLAALAGADYLNTRNVLPALVPLLAAVAVGCAASDRPRAGAALLAGLCALSLAVVVAVAADAGFQRPDWRGLARALGGASGPRALVVSPANGELALRYHRPAIRTLGPAGAAVREVDVIAVAGSRDPGAAPQLPPLVGTTLAVPGFMPAGRIRTAMYELLRFRAVGAASVQVAPDPLAQLRFGQPPPSIDLLPGGR
ncbi:MAG TPA: glycosyltransferase family 39 protein [Conexibacter sp.]|nr:glycosyltransferase family 39 protein [Conexibacter sp.]